MIPEAAVDAAARAWRDSALGWRVCYTWDALTERERNLRRDDARSFLEAAAAYMLADSWDEGHMWGWTDGVRNMDRPAGKTPNPYRSQV